MRGFGAIIIGDEILSGKRQDKHLAKVIEALRTRGLELAWGEYLGDDRERIGAALRRSFASPDIVFCFGGIGATPDDHTRQAAAAALGVPLERHPEAVREIEARFGLEAYPKRILMAEFPSRCEVIPNPFNRIPGFRVGDHHFLPGFPEMAWPMLEWTLDTSYAHLFHLAPLAEASIVVSQLPESEIIDAMNEVLARFDRVKVSSLPRFTADSREVELAVRGDPAQVAEGIAILKVAVTSLGYEFREMG